MIGERGAVERLALGGQVAPGAVGGGGDLRPRVEGGCIPVAAGAHRPRPSGRGGLGPVRVVALDAGDGVGGRGLPEAGAHHQAGAGVAGEPGIAAENLLRLEVGGLAVALPAERDLFPRGEPSRMEDGTGIPPVFRPAS